jgi:tetratricopeptide (TPR) repeat protein
MTVMPRFPVNSGRLLLSVAAVLLSGMSGAAPARAQAPAAEDPAALHDRCVALVRSDPQAGLDRAELWRSEGGGQGAAHCAAMALYALARYQDAALRFEELATAMMAAPKLQRAQTLDQAGQSWLAADEIAHAKADFEAALMLDKDDPDLLIDHAEAEAAEKKYWEAIDDLNRVIELSPNRPDAYVYRGAAYRAVDALDLALEDIEHGLLIEPDFVLGLLERGNTRRLKGNAAGAREDWLRIIKLAPGSAAAAAARVNLERMSAKTEEPPATAPAKPKPQ